MKKIAAIILIGLILAGSATALYHFPMKYATQDTIYFAVYDSNSPWQFYETVPDQNDIYISKDGGAPAKATNAPTDEGRFHSIVLTASEMTAAQVIVEINDVSSPALFGSVQIVIPTYGNASALTAFDLDDAYANIDLDNVTGTLGASEIATDAIGAAELATDAADEIADEVVDETLNGGDHRIKHSVADYLRRASGGDPIILLDGTAQAGAANTITLQADASATNDIYSGCLIAINGGTGLGQSRVILAYNGTTKVATVDKNWATNPSSDSEYQILAATGSIYSHEGTAQGSSDANSITLASTAESTNDIYNGYFIYLLSGTGSGQTRTITDYVGADVNAFVDTNWVTPPDNTTVYAVTPGGDLASDVPVVPGLTQQDIYDVLTTYGVSTLTAADVNATFTGTGLIVASGTVATAGTASSFTLSTDFVALAGAYPKGSMILVEDADDSHYEMGIIETYLATRVVTLRNPLKFTPANGDVVALPPAIYRKEGGRY